MDHATALPAVLRASLVATSLRSPTDAAVELARLADVAGLGELAALVSDPRASLRQRSVVLLAIGIVVARSEASMPVEAIDALDDARLVATALSLELGGALTGILNACPSDRSLDPTRRLIAHQLLAKGEGGVHVVQLLLDAGDPERASRVAAELIVNLVGDKALLGLATVLAWSEQSFFHATMQNLEALAPGTGEHLYARLSELPAAFAPRVSRARSEIVWAIDPLKTKS